MNFNSFFDELEKIGVKVPFVHGTYDEHKELRPGAVDKVMSSDPNPVAVYTAMRNKSNVSGVAPFAHASAKKFKGTPLIAHGKMDSRKGWNPVGLKVRKDKKIFEDVDDARRVVQELDRTPSKAERGPLWEKLQKGSGAWRNDNPESTLKVTKYKKAPTEK
jgi:hypothetical protein